MRRAATLAAHPGVARLRALAHAPRRRGGARAAMTVVVLLGAPGAGKGTQAVLLAEQLDIPHVATGDLFRAAVRDGIADRPRGATRTWSAGSWCPDDITIRMLLDRLARPDAVGGAILDGFPRNRAQAEALDAALAERRRRASTAAVVRRGRRRRSSSGGCPVAGSAATSGHVYNESTNPPQVAGRLRHRRLGARPARGRRRRDDPGAARSPAGQPARRHRPLREDRRPAPRRRPASRSTRSPPTCCASSATGDRRPMGGLTMVTRKSRAEIAQHASRRPGRRRGPGPRRARAQARRHDRPSRPPRRGATSAPPARSRRSRATRASTRDGRSRPACASRSTTRSSTASPATGRSATARSCRSTPAPSSTAGTATRLGRSSSATPPAPVQQLIDTTREAMMAGIAAAVPGNHIEDISAAVEDVAGAARLRHRAPVRRPRHRHRDARGAAGPQLPHRPTRPQARARPVPGHRADVHAGRLRARTSSTTTGPCRPSTARWPPTSSTRSP